MINGIIEGFKELWRGEQPLSHAFWIYFVMWWIGFFVLSFFVAAGFFVLGLRPLVPVIGRCRRSDIRSLPALACGEARTPISLTVHSRGLRPLSLKSRCWSFWCRWYGIF